MRVWYSGRAPAFQAGYASSILAIRSNMTPKTRKANLHKLHVIIAQQAELREKEEQLRAKLSVGCPHEVTEPYHWTHRGGYGIHTPMVGLRCTICRMVRAWKDMGSWSNPADWSSRDD